MSYTEALGEYLEQARPPYRQDTIETLGHWCRAGYMSEQRVLEFLELIEADRHQTDEELRQFDSVFHPQFDFQATVTDL